MAKIDVADYYRRLAAVGIADVAARLLEGRITKTTSAEIRANCPRHDSDSGTALHISPHEGLWYCHACGVGGDALQLVEFVQNGTVSKGAGSGSTDGHRTARDWLAGIAGLPPLAEIGATAEEIEKADEDRAARAATFQAMTELARFYHAALTKNDKVVDWLAFNYGITRETIDQLMIGLADDAMVFDKVASRCDGGARALSSTGAFSFDKQDHPWPFFKGRVVFPYWSGGRVVYMIARRLPWAADDGDFEKAKYKKLPLYNESLRPWISRAIETAALCGEDVLLSKPPKVVIVEGYTDWAVLKQAGFAAVALTSAHLSHEDMDRVVRRLRGVGTVYLAQDNELSSIGLEAAIKTARMLEREGVRCLVATIPTMPKHADARARLAALLGPEGMAAIAAAPAKDRAKTLRERAPEGRADDAEKFWNDAKVDVAEFFANGGTAAMFESALGAAKDAAETVISLVERVEDPAEMARSIAPLLAELSQMRPAARQKYLGLLKDRTGLSVQTLKAEATAAAKGAPGAPGVRHGDSGAPVIPTAEPGSCLEVVEREQMAAGAAGKPPNWSAIAERVYTWLADHGAKFFRDRAGAPSLFWENEVWPMTGMGGTRSRYEGLMYRLTHAVPTTAGAKTFYSTLAALASDRGTVRDAFPWMHADVARSTVWVNLNNARHEIARVSPAGVEIVRNGDNIDGIILSGDPKFLPFDFDASADAATVEAEIDEVLGSHLACRHAENKHAIIAWIMCLPLIGFSGTRPMIRFEGPAGSGKTWAAKMITTLVYGDEAQKKSTDAANYADAARNPLVALDNVEVNNATPALIDFLLTSVTGIVREKRAAGSDSGVVSERPTCLVMSTGIEPLAGELEEVMSRSFIIDFDSAAKDAVLLEKQSLARIKAARPRILSAILKRASAVLGLIANGDHETAMHAVRDGIKTRASARCDEYLALMYLQVVAASPMHNRDNLLCELAPSFINLIRRLDLAIIETARDSSQVATPMIAMFMALAEGKVGDAAFGLKVNDTRSVVRDASATSMFIALRQVARDRGTPFPYKNAAQFGVRLKTSIDVLKAHGIDVATRHNALGALIYTFTWDIDRGASTRLGPSAEADAFLGHEPREVERYTARETQRAFSAMGSGSAEDTP